MNITATLLRYTTERPNAYHNILWHIRKREDSQSRFQETGCGLIVDTSKMETGDSDGVNEKDICGACVEYHMLH